MNNSPFVSIVMLSYNTKQYLSQSIESILNQTYKNFELIIVEGNSNDGSLEIIKKYKDKDDRIKLFFDNGEGIGAALHLGCMKARGDLIARMDSDDICYPNRIDSEVAYLSTHKDCVLVSSAVDIIDENGCVKGCLFPCTDDRLIKESLAFTNMICHPMAMFRQKAYIEAGGYINVKVAEDRIFWSRLSKYGKFANIPYPLGQYRILNNSLSHQITPYDRVLYEFRSKIIRDDIISKEDIDLYNILCRYSKSFIKPSVNMNNKSIQSIMYCILKSLIGKRKAGELMCFLMNLYVRIQIHRK